MPSPEVPAKKGRTAERLWRFARDVNALGAIAFLAAGAIVPSSILTGLGAFNAAQAVSYEIGRQHARRLPKKRSHG